MKKNLKKHIPNILTTLRLAAVPFFWTQFLTGNFAIATTIFASACITDAIDGNLARKWGVESRYGKIVDPIADKTLVMSALLLYAIKINPIMFLSLGIEAGIAITNINSFIKKANLSNLKSKNLKDIINFILKNGNGNVNQIGKKKTVGLMTEISIALLTTSLKLSAVKLVNLLTLATATLQSATLLEYIENNNNEITNHVKNEKQSINEDNETNNITYEKNNNKSKNTVLKDELEKELEFLKEDKKSKVQCKKNIYCKK